MDHKLLLAILSFGAGVSIIALAARFAIRPKYKILWVLLAFIGFILIALGYLQLVDSINKPV